MDKTFCTRSAGVTLCAAVFLTLAACATTQPPPSEIAVARASIAQAESAGAADYASNDLLLARQKVDQADADVRDKHYAEAQSIASEAIVDADVAGRRARAAKQERAAQEVQRSNALLREESMRQPVSN